jgi:citrate/tricarballylate utilization protein
MAEIRADTYKRYTWPGALAPLLDRNLGAVLGVVAAAIVATLVLLSVIADPARLTRSITGPGAFYVVAPYAGLIIVMSAIVIYAVVVFAVGALQFWREVDTAPADLVSLSALWQATSDALNLRYQQGGGNGCYYPDAQRSQSRRVFHQLVYFGFLLDLISTCLAAVYQDWLDIIPPFDLLSLPVVLGTLGGIGIIVGCAGLLWLKVRSDPGAATSRMTAMDLAFLVVLLLAAITGLLTLILRETPVMGLIFAVHLGVIAAFFITMPYGKFAHIVYRYAALVRNSVEQRRAQS